MPVIIAEGLSCSFVRGFGPPSRVDRERRVADVLKGPSAIDVLVEVTSALLARISSQNSLWQICGMDGIFNNLPIMVTITTDLDC